MADAATEPIPAADAVAELPKTQEKLDELTKAAALQYSLKNFSAAADHYADAVEIQAELNGEMAPENAELLFYYGRALYKVAIAKSDVLGSKVASEEKKKPKAEKAAKKDPGEGSSAANGKEEKQESAASKPYFQLTGDENWDDSDGEEEEEEGEGQEEENDDFGNAYEVFEMARVLYTKQLEALDAGDAEGKGKGKANLTPEARALKEKVADCHGFLTEISLENERFHDAVSDARASLALQEELRPFEHENVTEGHYSLSLALEFASVRKQQTGEADQDQEKEQTGEDTIDYELRKEAAKHTDLAIQSLEARLKKEEAALSSDTLTTEQKKEKASIIKDKKDMLVDLRARVSIFEYDL